MPMDESSPSASAAAAHQTGDTQQGQSAGSGNLVVEGCLQGEDLHDSSGVGVSDIDEHNAEDTAGVVVTGEGARVDNRVLTDEDLVGRVVRSSARVPLRWEAGEEPGDLEAGEPRVGPREWVDELCLVGAKDWVVGGFPADRDEAVIPQSRCYRKEPRLRRPAIGGLEYVLEKDPAPGVDLQGNPQGGTTPDSDHGGGGVARRKVRIDVDHQQAGDARDVGCIRDNVSRIHKLLLRLEAGERSRRRTGDDQRHAGTRQKRHSLHFHDRVSVSSRT